MIMKNWIPRVGSRVTSHFRATWSGIVVDVYKSYYEHNGQKRYNHIVDVDVDTDQHGNPMRKKERHQLAAAWLVPEK